MPINELRSITTFTKVAELGSLRAAAAAQGITPQAASQALAQLEQHLGVRLMHRTTRSISLTAEGRQFLDAVQPSLSGLHRAVQVAQRAKEDIAGPLRIACPRSTFLPVLAPLLDEFCRLHPEVQPDVQMEDRIGNWVEDRVDVGFRVGASPAEGVVGRRLFALQLIVCAAPAYLQRHGAPQSLDDLGAHRCSVFRLHRTGQLMPWYFRFGDEVVTRPMPPTLISNEEELETQLVLSGQVIGMLTGITSADHIRAGRLVPLFAAHIADHSSVFIYYGSRASQPSRVRAFIDHAVLRLKETEAFVLSRKELMAAEAKGRKAAAEPAPLKAAARRTLR